jgi:hypothetical protein
LKTFCHVILGIPLFVLYLPCIYILVLVEICTWGHCTFFTETLLDDLWRPRALFLWRVLDEKSMRVWRFGRIDNFICVCFMSVFVYYPLEAAFLMVYYIPFFIVQYIRDSVIPCCIFIFRRGEQATSTEIKPHAVILKE